MRRILVPCKTEKELLELSDVFAGVIKIQRHDWVVIERENSIVTLFIDSPDKICGLRGNHILISGEISFEQLTNVYYPFLCVPLDLEERIIKHDIKERLGQIVDAASPVLMAEIRKLVNTYGPPDKTLKEKILGVK